MIRRANLDLISEEVEKEEGKLQTLVAEIEVFKTTKLDLEDDISNLRKDIADLREELAAEQVDNEEKEEEIMLEACKQRLVAILQDKSSVEKTVDKTELQLHECRYCSQDCPLQSMLSITSR